MQLEADSAQIDNAQCGETADADAVAVIAAVVAEPTEAAVSARPTETPTAQTAVNDAALGAAKANVEAVVLEALVGTRKVLREALAQSFAHVVPLPAADPPAPARGDDEPPTGSDSRREPAAQCRLNDAEACGRQRAFEEALDAAASGAAHGNRVADEGKVSGTIESEEASLLEELGLVSRGVAALRAENSELKQALQDARRQAAGAAAR
eukprot:2938376-Prymnesium_polylepis.1